MSNFKDLSGNRFSRLVVINRVQTPSHIKKSGRAYWLCRCDCGKEKIICSENLNSGKIKSCGCYKREMSSKPFGESAINARYSAYKHDAKNRNIVFFLTKEYFIKLSQGNCFYCNSKPSKIEKNKFNRGDFIYNGIDRIDNNKGYINGNVVSCCTVCNRAKREMTINEFYAWIDRLTRHRNNLKRKEGK